MNCSSKKSFAQFCAPSANSQNLTFDQSQDSDRFNDDFNKNKIPIKVPFLKNIITLQGNPEVSVCFENQPDYPFPIQSDILAR
jgi:hypothetical protein